MRLWQGTLEEAGAVSWSTGSIALVFGGVDALEARHTALERIARTCTLAGCSSAGDISGERISDDEPVVTVVTFDAPVTITTATARLDDHGADSASAGRSLARALTECQPRHVLVFAAGRQINGSALTGAMGEVLGPTVGVTGGIAGDGPNFGRTVVVSGGRVQDECITAIGICSDAVDVRYGSRGDWDPFGPERVITRSKGNVVHELDGEPALTLYERYLGDEAERLPSSGLLFPLSIDVGGDEPLVRTLLAVDREERSLTFAGDVPQGSNARMMRANFDRLVDGAHEAAVRAQSSGGPALALLISCVGRRLLLGQRAEEELDAARGALGASATMAGFYSYGEISPFVMGQPCVLHNQTMTITTLTERL
jgi:hypothetical protein